ncbi:hypothetical protein Tco_0960881 [Tanacetum coccineum]
MANFSIVSFYAINARRLPLALLVYTFVRPLVTTSVVTNSVFKVFFEKQKLTRPNFIDWYIQLRIVQSVEDKLDYLEQPIPPAHVPGVKYSVCSTSRARAPSDCERFSLLQIGRKAHGEDCLLSCHAIYGLKLHEQSPDQKKDYATSCNAGQAKSRKKNNKQKKPQGRIVGIKRLLDDLRVTAAKLMLLVYKLLLLVFRVNAAGTKLQLLKDYNC